MYCALYCVLCAVYCSYAGRELTSASGDDDEERRDLFRQYGLVCRCSACVRREKVRGRIGVIASASTRKRRSEGKAAAANAPTRPGGERVPSSSSESAARTASTAIGKQQKGPNSQGRN